MSTRKQHEQPGERLMIAYGANTNIDSMRIRCPGATPIGPVKLAKHRLLFRGVADIVPIGKAPLHGALWQITPECEKSLDAFEGYPHHYIKRTVRVRLDGRMRDAMVYVMRRSTGQATPSTHYERTLRVGYGHFGLPEDQIDAAIARALRSYHDRPTLWSPSRARVPAYYSGPSSPVMYLDRAADDDEHIGDVPVYVDDFGNPHF